MVERNNTRFDSHAVTSHNNRNIAIDPSEDRNESELGLAVAGEDTWLKERRDENTHCVQ